MNENQLPVVEEYEFGTPLTHKIDFIKDSFLGDCNNRYLLTFDPIFVYDIKLTNITNFWNI